MFTAKLTAAGAAAARIPPLQGCGSSRSPAGTQVAPGARGVSAPPNPPPAAANRRTGDAAATTNVTPAMQPGAGGPPPPPPEQPAVGEDDWILGALGSSAAAPRWLVPAAPTAPAPGRLPPLSGTATGSPDDADGGGRRQTKEKALSKPERVAVRRVKAALVTQFGGRSGVQVHSLHGSVEMRFDIIAAELFLIEQLCQVCCPRSAGLGCCRGTGMRVACKMLACVWLRLCLCLCPIFGGVRGFGRDHQLIFPRRLASYPRTLWRTLCALRARIPAPQGKICSGPPTTSSRSNGWSMIRR